MFPRSMKLSQPAVFSFYGDFWEVSGFRCLETPSQTGSGSSSNKKE